MPKTPLEELSTIPGYVTLRGQRLSLYPLEGLDRGVATLARGRAVTLTYEPGDATRYQLTICPVDAHRNGVPRWWMVCRGDGGYDPTASQVGATLIRATGPDVGVSPDDVRVLSAGNEHTAHVLSAAVNFLLTRVLEESPK